MQQYQSLIDFYIRQGAPGDQMALAELLRQLQKEWGGAIPADRLAPLAQILGTKESFLLAIIRRLPSLRLLESRVLELCAGPNCGKHTALAAVAETLCRQTGVTFRYMPCQRMCGKGPNVKYNGRLYHGADEKLLRSLLTEGR